MRVIFSHGKESGPWGSKIKRLASIAEELGASVASVDYQGIDGADERVLKLISVLKHEREPFILCGSSMGGYVSTVACRHFCSSGLFLMAPAFYLPCYSEKDFYPPDNTVIVHGLNDNVVPYKNSQTFVELHSSAKLHLINSDHRLNDSLDLIGELFCKFLKAT